MVRILPNGDIVADSDPRAQSLLGSPPGESNNRSSSQDRRRTGTIAGLGGSVAQGGTSPSGPPDKPPWYANHKDLIVEFVAPKFGLVPEETKEPRGAAGSLGGARAGGPARIHTNDGPLDDGNGGSSDRGLTSGSIYFLYFMFYALLLFSLYFIAGAADAVVLPYFSASAGGEQPSRGTISTVLIASQQAQLQVERGAPGGAPEELSRGGLGGRLEPVSVVNTPDEEVPQSQSSVNSDDLDASPLSLVSQSQHLDSSAEHRLVRARRAPALQSLWRFLMAAHPFYDLQERILFWRLWVVAASSGPGSGASSAAGRAGPSSALISRPSSTAENLALLFRLGLVFLATAFLMFSQSILLLLLSAVLFGAWKASVKKEPSSIRSFVEQQINNSFITQGGNTATSSGGSGVIVNPAGGGGAILPGGASSRGGRGQLPAPRSGPASGNAASSTTQMKYYYLYLQCYHASITGGIALYALLAENCDVAGFLTSLLGAGGGHHVKMQNNNNMLCWVATTPFAGLVSSTVCRLLFSVHFLAELRSKIQFQQQWTEVIALVPLFRSAAPFLIRLIIALLSVGTFLLVAGAAIDWADLELAGNFFLAGLAADVMVACLGLVQLPTSLWFEPGMHVQSCGCSVLGCLLACVYATTVKENLLGEEF